MSVILLIVFSAIVNATPIQQETTVHGNVQVADDVPGVTKALIAYANEKVILTCNYEGTSDIQLDWYSNDDQLESSHPSDQDTTQAVLTLTGLTKDDSGKNYTCGGTGLNRDSWTSYQIFIDTDERQQAIVHPLVEGAPVITREKETGVKLFGYANILMICGIVTGVVILTVTLVGIYIFKKNKKSEVTHVHHLARDSSIMADEVGFSTEEHPKLYPYRPLPPVPGSELPGVHQQISDSKHSYYYPNILRSGFKTPAKSSKNDYEPIATKANHSYYYPQIAKSFK